MTSHDQATFQTHGELIERIIAHVRSLARRLEGLDAGRDDDRLSLLLRAVVIEERRLAGALTRYLGDAPASVLDTYAQYSHELDLDADRPVAANAVGIADFVVVHHAELARLATQLAESADTAATREAFQAVATEIEGAGKVVAAAANSMLDL